MSRITSDKRCKARSTLQVLDALRDLHSASGEPVERFAVQEITGLKITTVDDRLKVLTDDGMIERVRRGKYAPVFTHRPARAISTTRIDSGIVKIEIGDVLIELVPREARALGKALAGEANELAAIEIMRGSVMPMQEISRRLRGVEAKMAMQVQATLAMD